jgi:hypothetical protein
MAKQSNVSNQSVAAAIANAMVGIDTSGICETICENLLARFGKGGAVSKEDGDAIAAEVSRLRKWTPKSAETRIKELRAFYGAYDLLPLALEKLRETKSNGKPITYDAGVKLARSLKAGKTVAQSVAAYIEGKAAAKVAPEDRTLEQSRESASTHVKRILEHKKLPSAFRSKLAALCVEFYISL